MHGELRIHKNVRRSPVKLDARHVYVFLKMILALGTYHVHPEIALGHDVTRDYKFAVATPPAQ